MTRATSYGAEPWAAVDEGCDAAPMADGVMGSLLHSVDKGASASGQHVPADAARGAWPPGGEHGSAPPSANEESRARRKRSSRRRLTWSDGMAYRVWARISEWRCCTMERS